MSQVGDFLTDKNGEQSKSKTAIMITLVVSVVVIVLLVMLRNSASAATSGGTSGGGSGGSGSTTTGTDYAGQLAYQQGLADIQNAQISLSESLQEKLLKAQTQNSEDVSTFNSSLAQTNTMNAINNLIYSEKQQFAETQSEKAQTITDSGNLLTQWYNTLNNKLANGQTIMSQFGGLGSVREKGTTNAVESLIFGNTFSGAGDSTGTPNSQPANPLTAFWNNFNPNTNAATPGTGK